LQLIVFQWYIDIINTIYQLNKIYITQSGISLSASDVIPEGFPYTASQFCNSYQPLFVGNTFTLLHPLSM